MARITVEDCLKHVDNRFELVLAATKRARQLENGAETDLPWENDKVTVMALREVATGRISGKILTAVEPQEEAVEEFAAAAEDEGEQPQQEV